MSSIAVRQLQDDLTAPVEAPGERASMGRISGVLWIVGAAAAVAAGFLPGAEHAGLGWVFALGALALGYGLASVSGWIPWRRASVTALGVGMAVSVPVLGLAIYLSGGSLSYVEPLLICSLLYAAFFFPAAWAWPLVGELVLVAAAPLLFDDAAVENAYLPRFAVLAVVMLAATWMMIALKRRLVEAERRQREAANRDPLTGVGNRRSFDAAMRRELNRRTRPRGRRTVDQSPLALLVIDLDDFKLINDRHGHQAGDAALCDAAARAATILRSTDTLARIGGDEFAVIAPGAHGEGARRMAESIRAAVGAVEPGSEAPVASASIGWAVYPEDGEDYETLLRCADRRMLRLKGRALAPSPADPVAG